MKAKDTLKIAIPSSFSIHGSTYTVEWNEKMSAKDGNNGEIDYNLQKIQIQRTAAGAVIHPERVGQVFCHELVHAILFEMDRPELNEDETFVNHFGSHLYQALSTMVYK